MCTLCGDLINNTKNMYKINNTNSTKKNKKKRKKEKEKKGGPGWGQNIQFQM